MKPHVIHSNSFAADAANIIAEAADEAVKERGIFRLALSGGSTPAPVYAELAREEGFPWEKTQITFGDERCVQPGDPQSNFRMAKETLLHAVPIPEGNVWRIRGELEPEAAAAEYDARLNELAHRMGEMRYRHDLLLLGMGDDGHTASLFPGTAGLEETERSVVANFVPKFGTYRITVTFPLIAAARHICFLVNGASKAALVQEILNGNHEYPAARAVPESGQLTWVLGF